MTLYSYVKKNRNKKKQIILLFSIILMLTGIGIIIWTIFPILSFQFLYGQKFGTLVQPIPDNKTKRSFEKEIAQLLTSKSDYTKASAWFPKATDIRLPDQNSFYSLSIPKLKIENATVRVGAEDLAQSLIHYAGALPGEMGGPIIFGHSTIPWIYNPKDYKTIFTKLPDLENGDNILVSSDNVTYKYEVNDMKIVYPDDLSVLKQNYDYQNITLVTCVPPGTYLKRLVILAKLVGL